MRKIAIISCAAAILSWVFDAKLFFAGSCIVFVAAAVVLLLRAPDGQSAEEEFEEFLHKR